ncbi:histone-lysine N-methyltransferase ash1 isoform X2 [Haematobia irritans]|uniref:histone-lysine N-methyltransferase ash1 isoform X2 n=1 Tax=Haematobia irritans TaxID=7368 RepID=UPI003F5033D6
MSTLNDAKSGKVLESQHQQRKESSSTHENKNEHEGPQRDKHKKRHEKKKHSNSAAASSSSSSATTNSSSNSSSSNSNSSISNLSNIALATQFSIQRTDSDGCLRMKISAIRPTVTSLHNTKPSSSIVVEKQEEPKIGIHSKKSAESIKLKISPPPPPLAQPDKRTKAEEKMKTLGASTTTTPIKAKAMSVIVSPRSAAAATIKEKKDLSLISLIPSLHSKTGLLMQGADSDVTDSGCSEATNTTNATSGPQEKLSKRKVKRKKSVKGNTEPKRPLKSIKSLLPTQSNAFSTDSEDEPLSQKLIANIAVTQRAPRLLLTALGVKHHSSLPAGAAGNLNDHLSLQSLQSGGMVAGSSLPTGGSDHIGLSSSDNELPNVRAAVARVVGDSDEEEDNDDDDLMLSHYPKAKTKRLPQYQSTLLQDFMEKTQMLGQNSKSSESENTKSSSHIAAVAQSEILVQMYTNSQSDSIASSGASVANKKRRGRPKKSDKALDMTINASSSSLLENNMQNKLSSNINESADSGVVSTTSISTQSTSPHPCTTLASGNDNSGSSIHSPSKPLNSTPDKQNNEAIAEASVATTVTSSIKPKIDIALLDKRMYATERVLYPPPRNKRRQSMSAANTISISGEKKSSSTSAATASQQSTRDDIQLDPVWRKIDVNRKFRRPSVCSTTGYKSDGDERIRDRSSKSTVCSKILAAKSGYVSDYGTSTFRLSKHTKPNSHNSGYKSDASCKSRYSTKSCFSRKFRAKSCGYRSDCKESTLGSSAKSSKFRRKRRSSIMPKSMGSLKDEQDILQLAGLSLGQSSEESNEYVCKPSLEKLPTTSASKKYGEINRYIATGEYFGRGSSTSSHNTSHKSFASLSNSNQAKIFDLSHDLPQTPAKISLHQRKNSTTSEFAHDLLQLPGSHNTARKIKSRRSSVASYCSSFYSVGTTKMRKRRRRKLFRSHNSTSGKTTIVDSKLLTEIEILTNTFANRCRIQCSGINVEKAAGPASGGILSQKEKLMAEATKLKQSFAAAAAAQAASTSSASMGKRDARDKKSIKKRKMSENLDFAMLSARAEGANAMCPSGVSAPGTSSKRRHKKASSSSPDDHKLPLKKRHYLLTPGEKSSDVAVAVAAKLFANNSEAWAAAAAAAKTTANTKSQQQFNAKTARANLTPKKRHLLQQHPHSLSEDSNSNKTASTLSPLRVAVGDSNSISGGKLLDISPQSLNSLKQVTEAVHKKRSRLEGLVSRIAINHHGEDVVTTTAKTKTPLSSVLQIESESSSCPPPGVFEPSVELEIQIPPMAKLTDATTSIITKSEVDSPLLMDMNKGYTDPGQKTHGQRVVESLLNKTGGNLILKRKRKKINRTGFPTVRRKKRKIQDTLLLDVMAAPQETESSEQILEEQSSLETISNTHNARIGESETIKPKQCDRVPQEGETSQTFLDRNNRTPRLSVVALERLQESPMSSKEKSATVNENLLEPIATPKSRHIRREYKRKLDREETTPLASIATVNTNNTTGNSDKKTKTDKVMPSINSKKTDQNKISSNVAKNPSKAAHKKSIVEATEDEEDNKPLASRARRSRPTKETKAGSLPNKTPPVTTIAKATTEVIPAIRKPPSVSKTVKSLLDANIKLPAGIDPSTLLSCKIKLKRRNSIHPLLIGSKCAPINAKESLAPPPPPIEINRTREEIEKDANAIDCNIDQEEHDILPLKERLFRINGETDHSDTSEEKAISKKSKINKKYYLPAGLFSDYFKVTQITSNKKTTSKKEGEKKSENDQKTTTEDKDAKDSNDMAIKPTLPPPPYCEKYLRRTQYDFELPYDIWWAYTNSKLPSRITVASWNFRKIRTNMYADNVKPPPAASYDHPMCNCKPDMGCGDNCLNRMVYTECSPTNCPTREKCQNQKIQRHEIAPGVERFMTENKGWGVRTKMPIPKGTYILEYVGEVVTEREFKDRMATIYLNDTHHYCLHLDGGLVIDGHRMGSDCRFVNHSCEPNCEIQKWSVNGLSRMALFAKRPIREGEELTYDYNFSLFNPSEGQPCRCNTPHCRGVIGGKSQRIKPLPIEAKASNEATPKVGDTKGRQRKRKAKKNTQRQTTKDVATPTRMQPISEKEKKLILKYSIFLVRNFEKIRAKKCKRKGADRNYDSKSQTPIAVTPTPISSPSPIMPGAIMQRRPSTPASLAAQITALCTARSIKTRGLTLAVQDPELEKMAKMAKVLRDICTALESIKNPENDQQSLISSGMGSNKKKKASLKNQMKSESVDFKSIQSNVEQGFYKLPGEFNADMIKLLKETRLAFEKSDSSKISLIDLLEKSFEEEKHKQYSTLLDILGDENQLKDFQIKPNVMDHVPQEYEKNLDTITPQIVAESSSECTEDIIRCICGLFKDEGLMIQCARCMVWQHTECTKADVNADNYHCERCEPRIVDKEIPLEDFTDEGHRYYLTLMRGQNLQVRQGDAVYVLRDIPVRDAAGNIVPSKKHTYETIGEIDYNECDIFRVERLWKDDKGKRFIFGHHFLRPHETYHEPSRKFYPNEVVRVPLYEVVPINLVIGRCWVLDRTTFCKGRPIECNDEKHCFICELRVDKSARFFSRTKTNHPTCTKSYAFRKFPEKLRISKTYAPHDVDPSLFKSRKQKTENECQSLATSSTPITTASNSGGSTKRDTNKISQTPVKKRQNSTSPSIITSTNANSLSSATIKDKRLHLENVLKTLKNRSKQLQTSNNERPLDLTYLLTGRGARQRKTPLSIRKDFV